MAKDKVVKKQGARKISAYNAFMKTEVPKVRKENATMTHKDAFKKAASNWATSPENPKNKKAAA